MSRWSGDTKAMHGTLPPVYRLAVNSAGLRFYERNNVWTLQSLRAAL